MKIRCPLTYCHYALSDVRKITGVHGALPVSDVKKITSVHGALPVNGNGRRKHWSNQPEIRLLLRAQVCWIVCRIVECRVPVSGDGTLLHSKAPFLTGCTASLYYISQCLFVRYRFSRQPLNRLFWNLRWASDMMSERELNILGSNAYKINDLPHELCVTEGPKVASKAIDVIDVR